MKTGYWFILAAAVWLLSFLAGYKVSYSTGIQPGYFEAAEAGGYGGGGAAIEGLDKATQDYYKELYKQK